jgi:hypothetical protein
MLSSRDEQQIMIREINDNGGWGEVVYSYTRQQAIEDGVLVDLSDLPIVRKHWRSPLACTFAVWSVIKDAVDAGRDLDGILHDLFWLSKIHIQYQDHGEGQSQILFTCQVGSTHHEYKLHLGPGDDGEPVLTLMFSTED